jgi:mRNA-degrading endonuclease YafQ of YafQ-DinJ toxin-antitoxin module
MDRLKYVMSLIMEDSEKSHAILDTRFKDHQLTGDKKADTSAISTKKPTGCSDT